jgi:hypothetical protein
MNYAYLIGGLKRLGKFCFSSILYSMYRYGDISAHTLYSQ